MQRRLSDTRAESAMMWSIWALAAAVWLKVFNQWAADYDLWMHLKVGEQILSDRTVFLVDKWSFTAPGAPVTDHEWLVHVAMTSLYQLAGDGGLMLWRGSFVLAIAAGMFQLSRPAGNSSYPIARPALLIAAAIVLGPGLSFRPQLISYLGLILLLILAYPRRSEMRPLQWWAVVLVFWIWANCHGGFALGIVVWGWIRLVALCKRPAHVKTVKWWVITGVPVAITLATPHGWGLWQFVWQELSNPIAARFITEWRPFSFEPREWPFLLWAVGLFALAGVQRRRLRLLDVGLGIMAIGLGLASVRHSPLLPILTMPMAAGLAGLFSTPSDMASKGAPAGVRIHAVAAGCIAIAAVLLGLKGVAAPWKITADREPLPVTAVHLIKENHLSGSLWVPLHWGGYAVFHLHPKVTVSVDGRWTMVYPRSVMADHMAFDQSRSESDWKPILERYGAQMALVTADHPVAAQMVHDEDWVLILKGESAGLFFHRTYLTNRLSPLTPPAGKPDFWP